MSDQVYQVHVFRKLSGNILSFLLQLKVKKRVLQVKCIIKYIVFVYTLYIVNFNILCWRDYNNVYYGSTCTDMNNNIIADK